MSGGSLSTSGTESNAISGAGCCANAEEEISANRQMSQCLMGASLAARRFVAAAASRSLMASIQTADLATQSRNRRALERPAQRKTGAARMIIDLHTHVFPPEDWGNFTGTQFHK